MPKWCKLIVAMLLLPLCFGAVQALWLVLTHSGQAVTIWVGFLSGAACWLVIFYLLPKPMWIYVFGHELTHALWTWLFGGRVKRFKATSKGGHVMVTKTNFLIALAPYFFPVYAALVVLLFVIGHLIWNWAPYVVCFHLLLGAAYAFHVTLTWHILKTEQSDITQHGYFFSAVVIFLGNMAVLLVGVPLLTAKVGVLTSLGWWLECNGAVLARIGGLVKGLSLKGFVKAEARAIKQGDYTDARYPPREGCRIALELTGRFRRNGRVAVTRYESWRHSWTGQHSAGVARRRTVGRPLTS